MFSAKLTVSDLRLWVHLGCSPEEKARLQEISVEVSFSFGILPAGVKTDALQDTFCYAEMVGYIQHALTKHQPFNLVEHLAGCLYATIYRRLLEENFNQVLVQVTVNKLAPPVPCIHGGVSFTCQGNTEKGKQDDLYQHWR